MLTRPVAPAPFFARISPRTAGGGWGCSGARQVLNAVQRRSRRRSEAIGYAPGRRRQASALEHNSPVRPEWRHMPWNTDAQPLERVRTCFDRHGASGGDQRARRRLDEGGFLLLAVPRLAGHTGQQLTQRPNVSTGDTSRSGLLDIGAGPTGGGGRGPPVTLPVYGPWVGPGTIAASPFLSNVQRVVGGLPHFEFNCFQPTHRPSGPRYPGPPRQPQPVQASKASEEATKKTTANNKRIAHPPKYRQSVPLREAAVSLGSLREARSSLRNRRSANTLYE